MSEFIIYCIENYKEYHNLSGKETYLLFERFNVIDFIKACYEALHTTSKEYVIEDIDHYLKVRKSN